MASTSRKTVLGDDISGEKNKPMKDGKGVTGSASRRNSATRSENVIGTSTSKGDEAERIAKRMESDGIPKRLAAAQIEGGDKLTVDGPGSSKNPRGVIKAR